MLLPTNVTTKQECVKAINNLLHGGSNSNNNNDAMTELTKDTFYENTDYRVVYKNFVIFAINVIYVSSISGLSYSLIFLTGRLYR